MDHAIGNFHAGGKPIRQHATGFAFKDRQQPFRQVSVAVIHVECRCKLAFNSTRYRFHLARIPGDNNDAERTEHLMRQNVPPYKKSRQQEGQIRAPQNK